MSLSTRLLAIAEFIKDNSTIADIGTDHALLPIHLEQNKRAKKIIASDINSGPLKTAKKNIKEAGCTNIEIIESDGIDHIKDKVDYLVAAGMGGKLISDILKHDNLKKISKLVLQPNVAAHILRGSLSALGFKIVDEVLVEDGKVIYEIIYCEKGKQQLSTDEIYFGPVLIKSKGVLFDTFYQKRRKKLRKIIKNVPQTNPNYKHLQNEIDQINKVLK